MTTEAKVGAFVLGCFSVLAVHPDLPDQRAVWGTHRSIPHVPSLRRRAGTGGICAVRRNRHGKGEGSPTRCLGPYQD